MPKVTFPHMGESWRAFKMLLNDLGNEVIVPEKPNKRTLDFGVRYSPEFACLPLKILMGSYMEACLNGAEIIVTSGGSGPCRAGLYGQVHKKILNAVGQDIDVIVFESPRAHPIDFLRNIKKLNPGRLSYLSVYDCVTRSWEKLKYLDRVEKLTHSLRPIELEKGNTSKIYQKVIKWLDDAHSLEEIKRAGKAALEELLLIPRDLGRNVVKIGIVGEIFVLLEPSCNLDVEETLGHLGVEVHRSIFLTDWTRDNSNRTTQETLTALEAAKPYLPTPIGGHGQETVGHTVLYANKGYDGVIQLAPFTCIPEIVAKTVLNGVSKIHNIPVLTFFLDEQTGKAGMVTRLEAFVDLVNRKRTNDNYDLKLGMAT
ncbi:MAG: CoA protein activase [Peptococcaceae bacterium]|nr:CoA protein activase [Peptococcaceae bacterium]